MQKWVPTTDLLMLRRMGKTTEELGELQAVVARCIIQGIDEIDPASGEVNRLRLEKETADVLAQCICNIKALRLDRAAIEQRTVDKVALMDEWESLFGAQPDTVFSA
jgi:NTP pyrophosphatase (non-canonical NTP hydrolase)